MKKKLLNKPLISLSLAFMVATGFANIDKIARMFAPAGTITGVVYRDINYNGVKDATVAASGTTAGYDEPFVAGITVNAYNDAGVLVGTTTTTATGPSNYSLSGAAITGKLRLEFVNIASGDFSTKNGADNGTTVQFVDATTTATADLGVSYPDDYCGTTNPNFTFTRYLAGSGVGNTGPAYTQLPYNASNTTPAETVITGATQDALGSLWGVAYNKTKKLSYASAYLKRHVGIGDRGYDGIYVFDHSTATPALVGGIDLQGVVPANGGAAIDFGTVTRTLVGNVNGTGANDLSSSQTNPSRDSDAYAKVGKVGYGDIDFDFANNLLWAVNLAERSIISIDMSTNIHATANPNTVPAAKVNRYFLASMAGLPTAASGTLRPFALKIYRGKVYVGLVDDGASLSTADMTASQKAYVVSFNAAAPGALTTVTSFPLNYNRERSWVPFAPTPTFDALESDQWQRWIDTYTDPNAFGSGQDGTTGDFHTGINGLFVGAPQPMLADIEFDTRGDMILGFQDRFASQFGWGQYLPSVTNTTTRNGVSHGDIIMAYNNNGTFVFEGPNENDNFTTPTAVAANAQPGQELTDGPSGAGEFFRSDAFIGSDATHPETSFGALAYLPGTQEILSTTFDPNDFNAQGFRWFSQNTGFQTDFYSTDTNTGISNFGKGQDLGDIELICSAAPIEIGNRVWVDTDSDGIQDPSELPIANVSLELFADFNNDGVPDGAALGTTSTNSTGNYYFNDANVADGDPTITGAQLGLQPDKNYIIRVAAADWTGGAGVGDLSGLKLTTQNAVPSAGATDLSDSDATIVANIPQISVLTGDVGENNHTLDMGFFEPVSIGSTVFQDVNNDGTQNATEVGLAGAVVKLYKADGTTPVLGPDGSTPLSVTTDATGNYFFAGLPPGQYVVGVTPPATWPTSSSTTVTTDITTDDGKDNGTQASSGAEAKSAIITLAVGAEPVGATENGTGTGGALDNAAGQVDANGDMTVDFGFYAPVSIGSTVFMDSNNDGIQNPTEVGLAGAVVKLYDAAGVLVPGVPSQTTNGTGDYYFPNLPPGNYIVGVTPPSTTPSISSTTVALDNQVDGDNNGGAQATPGAESRSPIINLTSLAEPTTEAAPGVGGAQDNATPTADASGDMTVDFGFYAPVSIGSTVFFDANNNGAHDGTEVGIAGAVVKLYKADGVTPVAGVATITTDGTGNYYFGNLPPGDYVVGVTPPSTYPTSSTTTVTADENNPLAPGDGLDNGTQATSGAEAKSPVINLSAGAEPTDANETAPGTGGAQDATADNAGDMTVDFGFFAPVSIGSTVFNDANNNGTFDGTEVGLAGAVVKLYYADGSPVAGVASITTNGTGNYYFGNLPPGDYKVGVTPPASAPVSSTTTVTVDENNPAAPGDNKDNGTQAGAGLEAFSPVINLSAGNESTGSNESGSGGGADDASSDASGDMTVDFGFFQPVSIGSTVFYDENNNGKQDPSEVGIAGAVVTLYQADGVTPVSGVPTQNTNGTGLYYFENLMPGTYVVGVQPASLYPTSSTDPASAGLLAGDNQTDGDDNGVQSGGAGAEAKSSPIVLTAGLEPTGTTENAPGAGGAQDTASGDNAGDMTIDFGFFAPVSIGSTVFNDVNNNGTQDAGDLGMAGAVVKIYKADGTTPATDANGALIASITTDASGNYYFGNLAPGDYVVGVTPPVAYPKSSTPTVTTDENNPAAPGDGKDNGTQSTLGGEAKSPVITLNAGTEPTGTTELLQGVGGTQDDALGDSNGDMTVDFGFFAPVSIGSLVYKDVNNDGNFVTGDGDVALAGALVTLYNADGVTPATDADGLPIAPITTLANGLYYFGNLLAGDYIVGVTPPSAVSASSTPTVTTDDNGGDGFDNGTQSAPGAEAKSPVISLLAGTEPSGETLPGGTSDNPGGILDATSDTAGDMTVDFGFYAPVSIGSLVFNDLNNNGSFDSATETPLTGAVVQLYDATGNPAKDANGILVAPITTDGTGLYYFGNLLPGDYKVGVTPPSSAPVSSAPTVTTDDNGASDGKDHGTQPSPGAEAISGLITLSPTTEASGETSLGGAQDNANGLDSSGDMSIDFGFFQPVSIGSMVYLDKANNGAYDSATDTPILGATVTLYKADGVTPATDVNGAAIAPITTLADGLYYFRNLLPGDYVVGVTPPTTTPVSSTPTVTTDDNGGDGLDNGTQSAPGAEAKSPVITLTAGAEASGETMPGGTQDNPGGLLDASADSAGDMTVDFGFFAPVSIGSMVYLDKANNGAYDSATDTPLEGATVTLYKADGVTPATDATGATIAPVITSADGLYYFGNLLPGDYKVGVTPPASTPTSSTPTITTDDNGGDGLDNGTQASSGSEALSPVITLTSGLESTSETMPGGTQDNPGGAGDLVADNSGDMTVDFGFYAPVSIGSLVYIDANNNGLFDVGTASSEDPLAGAVVKLYNADGSPAKDANGVLVPSFTTLADGLYYFGNLLPGDYKVGVTPPSTNPISSTPTVTTDDNGGDGLDNGTQSTPGGEALSPVISLTPGAEPTSETLPGGDQDNPGGAGDAATDANGDMTVDFGFVPTLSLGSTVFIDTNNNGVQDTGEGAIKGASVQLYDGLGTAIGSPVLTDDNGNYLFTGLLAGDYIIGVTPATGSPYQLSSTPASIDPDLGDVDLDDNGVQSIVGGEAKSGVVTLAAGLEPTEAASAIDATGGTQDDAADTNGNMTVDFGFYAPMSIGSLVYSDKDNNGNFNGSDTPLEGATVKLYNADGTPAKDDNGVFVPAQTTLADGLYFFNNLLPGTYKVGVTPPTSTPAASTTAIALDDNGGDGLNNGTQATPGTGEALSPVITLEPGLEPSVEAGAGGAQDSATTGDPADLNGDMTVDFGFFAPASLGNYVWNDLNGDGLQTSNEPGIKGVTVTLTLPDNTTISTVTDDNGLYSFSGLFAGTYSLSFTSPANFTPTFINQGNDDTKDSDGPQVNNITLAAGENNPTFDTGYIATDCDLMIGGIIYIDNSGTADGVNGTPIDGPKLGVHMTLVRNGAIYGVTPVNASGYYQFTNLPTGIYNIVMTTTATGSKVVQLPTGYKTVSEGGDVPLTLGGNDTNGVSDGDGGNNSETTIIATCVRTIYEKYGRNFPVLPGHPYTPYNPNARKSVDNNIASAKVAAGTATYLENDFGITLINPLPIDLVNFNAKQIEDAINLSWKTSNEKDFSHFEVQKSINAKEFGTIATVIGNNGSLYNQVDSNPIEGVNYYRLKMVDKDGKTTLSNVISVNFEKGASFVTVENPARDGEFLLNTNLKEARFTLLNSLGIKINFEINAESKNAYRLRTLAPAGVYYLNIESNGKFITRKIVIQ